MEAVVGVSFDGDLLATPAAVAFGESRLRSLCDPRLYVCRTVSESLGTG